MAEGELREFCKEVPLKCLIDDLTVHDRSLRELRRSVGEDVIPFDLYSPFVREKVLKAVKEVLQRSGEGVVYVSLGRYRGKKYYFLAVDGIPLSLVVSRNGAERFLRKLTSLLPYLSTTAREEIRGILSLLYFKGFAERVVEVEKKLEERPDLQGQSFRPVLRAAVVKPDTKLFLKRLNLVRLTNLTDFLSKVSCRLLGKENSVIVRRSS